MEGRVSASLLPFNRALKLEHDLFYYLNLILFHITVSLSHVFTVFTITYVQMYLYWKPIIERDKIYTLSNGTQIKTQCDL
jgi:hypothetical protein